VKIRVICGEVLVFCFFDVWTSRLINLLHGGEVWLPREFGVADSERVVAAASFRGL